MLFKACRENFIVMQDAINIFKLSVIDHSLKIIIAHVLLLESVVALEFPFLESKLCFQYNSVIKQTQNWVKQVCQNFER